jgi:hypothetical protein
LRYHQTFENRTDVVRFGKGVWQSSNDATFFEAEVVAPARSRRADNDVIDQLQLEDFAGFKDSTGWP